MCWSQPPFPQLCHRNIPVSCEEHNVSQFQLFRESFSPLSDNMLCLLVLFHCFVLKLCVLYAQFITPGICCSEWHQPGNVTWQFIGQRNHYSFPFFSFCNRRCSLQKKAPSLFSGILLLCSHLTLTIAPITTQKCYRAYVGSTELNQEEGSDLV